MSAPTPEVLRFAGVVLPENVRREVFVTADGSIRFERPAGTDARTVDTGGYLVPGLVDAHCHVGLDADGPVSPEAAEQQAIADRDAGALLIRDAGSAADTRWIDDRPDLPRIIRAGRHIARPKRYLRNYAAEVEPAELVTAVIEQAGRGDGWVKLVGDWIDRDRGDLAPLWSADVLREAIAAAHAAGARVTAHVFGSEAIDDLLAAGIDCLEHATGATTEHLERMAAAGVALVPTRLQVDNFPTYAARGEARFPTYAAHIRKLYAGVDGMLRTARDLGVRIYAGTDAGGVLPHGLIAQEIRSLTDAGLDAYDALAAGSWAARAWLGMEPTLTDGSPADFVVYDGDPLENLAVLARPRHIVLRGRVLGPG